MDKLFSTANTDLTAKSAICILIKSPPHKSIISIYEKNADLATSPASITKLLTALTAIKIARSHKISPLYEMTVLKSDDIEGSGRNLREGDRLTFHDGLANLILTSSNITANVIAREFGSILQKKDTKNFIDPKNRFVLEMNILASEIKMTSSRFINPHGLPFKGQLSTARDLSKLAIICSKNSEINRLWGKIQLKISISGLNAREMMIKSIFIISTLSAVPGFSIPHFKGGKSGTLWPSYFNLAAVSELSSGDRIVTISIGSPSLLARYKDYLSLVKIGNSIERSRTIDTKTHQH